MGIIQQQTIKGTIYSYLGVLIGFVTTALIFPKVLTSGEIGLLKLLVSYSILFAQFGSLGFGNVINRLFPYFRDKESGHKGFVSVAMALSILGFLLSWLVLELFKPVILKDDAGLLGEYFSYLVPLIFFTLFFNLFDAYIKALYDAVIGTMLKELIQRILILGSVLLYAAGIVGISWFVFLYVLSLSFPAFILGSVLIIQGQFRISRPGRVFDKPMIREMLNLCFYGILAGFGTMGILQIDAIIVNHFLGISLTGVYATTLYFAAIILIPSRPLIKISTTVLAEAWKRDDLHTISVVYQKSSLNQAVIATLIFIGLWVNIDNIFRILPVEFAEGKAVILFAGLANVVEMATGVNSAIIQTSRYYRLSTILIFLFLALLILFTVILIPEFGLAGAGMSLLFSNVMINAARYYFLRKTFGLNPFNRKMLLVPLIAGISFLAGYFVPWTGELVSDIIVRSAATGIPYIVLSLVFKVSDEMDLAWLRFRTFLKDRKL